MTNLQLCEARPDLNGAHFLWLEKRRQKIAGVEGGKRRPKYSIPINFNLIFTLITFSKKYFFIDLIDELLLQR